MLKAVSIFLFALAATVAAFQPEGPPPTKTVAWTARFAERMIIPRIRYENEPLSSVLKHLQLIVQDAIPPDYSVALESRFTLKATPVTVTMNANDLTLLEALSRVAEQVHADILVQRGVLTLVPQ